MLYHPSASQGEHNSVRMIDMRLHPWKWIIRLYDCCTLHCQQHLVVFKYFSQNFLTMLLCHNSASAGGLEMAFRWLIWGWIFEYSLLLTTTLGPRRFTCGFSCLQNNWLLRHRHLAVDYHWDHIRRIIMLNAYISNREYVSWSRKL